MNLCAVDGAVESDAEFDTEALTTVEHCIEVEQPRRVQCRWLNYIEQISSKCGFFHGVGAEESIYWRM